MSLCFFLGALAVSGAQEAGAKASPFVPQSAGTKPFCLGIGVENNMNSQNGFAMGTSVTADVRLFPFLALGLSAGVSQDFKRFTTFEPALMGRWYVLELNRFKALVFVQADLGLSLAWREDGEFLSSVLGGVSTGVRIPLRRDYYLEPAVRAGYPFMWGIALRAGCRL